MTQVSFGKKAIWFVTEPGKESVEVHCSPPASISEVLDGRPDGTTATPTAPSAKHAPSAKQGGDINVFRPLAMNSVINEPWRDRLLVKLNENPALNYAIEVALPKDESHDIEVHVARRGVGTFTVLVPRGNMTLLEGQLKIAEFCCKWINFQNSDASQLPPQ